MIMLSNKNRICDRVTDLKGITIGMLFLALTGTISLQNVHASQDSDSSLTALAQQVIVDKSEEVMAISMDIKDIQLHEALEILTEEIGVGLSYNSDIALEKKVTLRMSNVPFHEVLYALLEGTNLEPVLPPTKDVLVIREKEKKIIEAEILQETVRGQVIDSQSGESLPGVNILVKGTSRGGVTDVTGNFEFSVPSINDTLIVTYVGYQTIEEPINGRTVIDFQLDPLAILGEELVVVGYGVQQQLTLSGSVSMVDSDKINAIPTGDAASRLAGRVAGVRVTENHRPSGGSVVRIRGIGSIGDNSPLYVVDGVPVNDINGINPNDIESMSVLKDAASSAIYGSRAANGVVVITTRRGQENTPLRMQFSARYGIQQATNQLQLLNSQELGEKKWQELINDGLNVGDGGWGDLQYGFGAEPTIPEYTFPSRGYEGDAGTDPSLYNFGDPYYGITRANPDGTVWLDEIFEASPVEEYSLQVSGGTENTRYSITGSYLNNEGILIHTGYSRYNLRTNLDFNLTDWAQIGTSLGATLGEIRGTTGTGAINAALRFHPMLPVYDIMGNFAGTKSPGTGNQNNPVAIQYRNQDDRTRQMRLLASTYAQFDILDRLNFRTTLGVDLNDNQSKNYGRANPEFTQTNFGNSYSESSSGRFQYNWSNTLNFIDTFRDSHSISFLVGSELVSYYADSFSASRNTYAFEDVDYMVLNAGESNQTNSGNFDEWALFSYFARLNYDYQEKYMIEAVIRRDASSRFTGDYRWGTFPAISAAWRPLEDLGQITFIDDLKLRASWGQNGNDNVGNYNQFSTYISHINNSFYAIDGSNNSVTPGFRAATIGNPNARWETNRTINFGLDLQFFNYALEAVLDVYERRTTDMLYPDTVPATFGVASRPDVNIGEMRNTGIDFMLTYRGSAGSDLFYTISGNITHYKNEVIALNNDPDEFQYGFSFEGTPSTITRGGIPVSSFYGYDVEGIFNTWGEVETHAPFNPDEAGVDSYSAPGMFKFRDVNGDGVITPDDRTIIGNPHPDFVYGINIDLNYRNWDTTLFFEGSYGNDIYNHVRREILFNRYDGNFLRERLYESWTPERYAAGETITVPISTNNDAILQSPSSFLVEDGSYFKLKNLQAGYTLPMDISSRLGIQQMRVYFQATNVFTITNYSGLDPELSSGNDLSIGVDTSVYPTARILSLGVNINL